MRNKYNNKPYYVGDHCFQSKGEAKRYKELCALEKAGIISNLRTQVAFPLIPTQRSEGKETLRSVRYVADFVYNKDGEEVVEDFKGYRTAEYKLKKKLMAFIHNIWIVETE